MDQTSSALCGHTQQPVIPQRTLSDCMTCCLAMLTGRSYEAVTLAAQAIFPDHEPGGVLTHNLMRRIAHEWGFALLSSIYMDWRYPGIVGVVSQTLENCGHALFWDGAQLIDPGGSGRYDLAYVQANAIEFTQRAVDLAAVIELERSLQPAGQGVCNAEYF